ncbi:MAG: LPS export ABC transporter periplasmic protein LptC [Treponema sp.]|nr:LPS export ABC transporter periplasmic protein LptC [Treponema sp.]
MKHKRQDWPCRHYLVLFCILLAACSFNYDTVTQDDNESSLIMENTEYTRMVKGNPEIQIRAEEVRRYETKHSMELDNFSFEQYNAAPERQETIPDINARGSAAQARIETDTNNLFIAGGVNIEVISENITIETEELSWQDGDRILRAPGMVNITRTDGTTLKGTGFTAEARTRSWEFESSVEGLVVEEDK